MTVPATASTSILPPQLIKLLPYYVLFFAVMIFYSNVYDNAFLYDDLYLIQQNAYIQSWHNLKDIFTHYVNGSSHRAGHFYRPLQNIVYLIVYEINGPSLFGFHLLNVLLHATNVCLLYALGRRMSFSAGAVFCAALIWALHPLHTEAVTYMSATADVLFTFFGLLAVIAVFPNFSPIRMCISALLMILGLLSKETAIIYPMLVMSVIYLAPDKRWKPKSYLCTLPLWLVAIVYLVVRFAILSLPNEALLNIDDTSKLFGQHIEIRTYTALATLPSYLKLMLWPQGLHMDRDFPVYFDAWQWEVWAGISMVVAALACVVWQRKSKKPAMAWGLIWFAAAHIPQTGIIVPVNSLFLEHWMYMPSIGLVLGAAETLALWLSNQGKKIIGCFVCSVALLLGWLTYQQNAVWNDPVVFYHNILDRGEMSARARTNLGVVYMERSDFAHAMEQFKIAIDQHDITPEAHQDIASLLSKMPVTPDHIRREIIELDRAIELNPDFLPAYTGLADIYVFLGDTDKAAYYQTKAEALRNPK